MARVMLTARLRPGARERARELATEIRTDPDASYDRFSVYLSEFEVVFMVEAPDAEQVVRRDLNDPVRSTQLSPWLPLFDGPLHRAYEVYDSSRVAG